MGHAAKRTKEAPADKVHRFTDLAWWYPRYGSKRRYTLDPFAHRKAPVSKAIVAAGGAACFGTGGFEVDWRGHTVWANPDWEPKAIAVAITKAFATMHEVEVERCALSNPPAMPGENNGILPRATRIDMLLPGVPDRRWWLDLVEPVRDDVDASYFDTVITKFCERMPFGTPECPVAQEVPWDSQLGYGCVALTWDTALGLAL